MRHGFQLNMIVTHGLVNLDNKSSRFLLDGEHGGVS